MSSICKMNCCNNKLSSSYLKKTLEMLGPVILGSKPSEILNISGNKYDKEIKLNEINSFLMIVLK